MTHARPRRLLLATDLSSRCDRALDRAVQLALEWDAELTVLHVLPRRTLDLYDQKQTPAWRRRHDPARQAERSLRHELGLDIGHHAGLKLNVRVEEGEPAETVLRLCREMTVDLIVTGVASDGLFMPVALGSTVDELLRRATVPVLIVRHRMREPYTQLLVATDFSDASRHALLTADRYFPNRPLLLLHAFQVPFERLGNQQPQHAEAYRTMAHDEGDNFLADTAVPAPLRQRARLVIEQGTPPELLNDFVGNRQVDLVVMGAKGRHALLDVLLGSTTRQVLAQLPCDVMVVRQPAG